jgi:16S rRNA G966 N2-methylase RsmD
MGNTNSDTINWNSIKTENISDTNKYYTMLNDSKLLVDRIIGGGKIEDKEDYENLKIDDVGKYSLSHKKDADKLSHLIKNKYGDIKIMDATSSVGGNSISFGSNFTHVISVEQNLERFEMLKENIKSRNLNNTLIHGNFINFIDMDYKLIFLDPPWGGPDYKKLKKTNFGINNTSLKEVTQILKNKGKIIVWKLPFNYDLNEFRNFRYKLYRMKKYILVFI